MESRKTATVYRFRLVENGREFAPRHMWGTLEAIGTLTECAAIMESSRQVPEEALENGFVYRTPEAAEMRTDQ
jgi:hypothetical protein